jgi:hypothetical protein
VIEADEDMRRAGSCDAAVVIRRIAVCASLPMRTRVGDTPQDNIMRRHDDGYDDMERRAAPATAGTHRARTRKD